MVMHAATRLTSTGGIVLILAAALGGCGKMKQNDPADAGKMRAEAKRQRAACGSSAAYDRLKGLLFDQAIGDGRGDRAKLDMLADYSFARMEDPVVKGWDPALDITRCKGRFILQLPPGAKRAFDGRSRLEADIDYTAQAAADGSGFVYQLKGAEPIVTELAAFNLAGGAYRPPPAIDTPNADPAAPEATAIARADVPAPLPSAVPTRPAPVARPEPAPIPRQRPLPPERAPERAPEPAPRRVAPEPDEPAPVAVAGEMGEATVRAFYAALGAGNGAAASAQVIPEKRDSRAFSPEAITRFYGKLAEPVRLTRVVPLPGGGYTVTYRYSTGRSHCNGRAVVNVAHRDGRDLIRSIRALSGC